MIKRMVDFNVKKGFLVFIPISFAVIGVWLVIRSISAESTPTLSLTQDQDWVAPVQRCTPKGGG